MRAELMIKDDRKLFAGACGLAGSLSVRLEDGELSDESPLQFEQPYLIVGRDSRADVVMDDSEVSRRHAFLQVVDGRLFCVDLGSRTGIRWGDDRRPVGWVEPGQGIGIGPFRLRFDGVAPGAGEHLPISRSFAWSTLPDARIEFPGPGPDRVSWQVSRALVLVGSSATCRIRFEGAGIAGVHAAILRTPSGIWVIDLLGPADVTVAGIPVRSRLLEDGDEVGVGAHRFRVRVGQAARPDSGKALARRSTGREVRPALARPGPSPGAAATPPMDFGLDSAGLMAEFDRMHQRTSEQFQQAILMMFKMHQDQMGVIRDELSKIDRLEEELRSLQSEPGRFHTPSRVALRLVGSEPARPDVPAAGPAPAQSASGTVAAEVRPTPPTGEESRAAPDDDAHARLSLKLAELQAERRGLWKKLLGSLSGDEASRLLP